jgi:hypothetical protein
LVLELNVYSRRGTDPVAAFLIDSPRNTTFRMRSFWSMLAGI